MEEKIEPQARILYILKVLREHSDEEHHISYTVILNYLKEYGIICDRKTVARNIDALIKFGFDIVKVSGGGCYILNENFDSSELTFLVDSIFSSPAISQKQAEDIIARLTANVSNYEKKKYKNIFKSNDIVRTNNREVFYNIDRINYAIENDKQISFTYNLYDENGKLIPRKDKKYVINPYFMINSKGKYFLICNKDNYDDLSNYRIDYITDIEIIDKKRKDISNTKEYDEKLNPVDYANEHIYMFSGQSKSFKLKLYNARMVNELIDWFGKDVHFKEEDGYTIAKLKANESAVIYWAMQYGENVEIVEPLSARTEIKRILLKMSNRYKD